MNTALPCLDLLEATPSILHGLMVELSDDDARWQPGPDRFSIAEVLAHRQFGEMIGVGEEAIFAGMNEKFQIWAPQAFEAKRREIENRISSRDGKAAALALLGRAPLGD